MAFGMTLGTRAGMGAAGVPPRPRPRSSVQMHGSSLRAGGRSYAGIPGGGGGVMTDDDAARARLNAERAAADNARAQSRAARSLPEQPAMQTSADVQREFDEAVGKLPGGTMGTSPDFTERNQYLKRLEEIEKEMIDNETRRAANPFSELLGIGKKEEKILQMRHAATMNQARRAHQFATEGATASAAKAAEERAANTWVPTKSTLPSGQVVQANALTGETRPAFVQTKKEEYDWGPEIGGSTTFTTEEPEMDQTIVEKNRQAAIDAQKAKAAEAARNREIAALAKKEIEVATVQSGLRRGEDIAGVNARKAAGAYDSPAKPEKGPTVNDIRETILARMGFAGEQDFKDNATMEDRAAFKAAMAEATAPAAAPGRDPAQGRKIAAPAPKFKKGQVYRGRTFIGEDGADPNDLKNWSSPK